MPIDRGGLLDVLAVLGGRRCSEHHELGAAGALALGGGAAHAGRSRPAIWRRTSSQRSPLRGAANARSSRAPSSPARITADDLAGGLVDLEPQLEPGAAGVSSRQPRSTRLGVVLVEVDLGDVAGPVRAGPGRRRRPRGVVGLVGRASLGLLASELQWLLLGGRRPELLGETAGGTVAARRRAPSRGVARPRRTRARSTRWTTSWAIRSPRRSVDRRRAGRG